MATHNKIGSKGENIAKSFLEEHGYTILHTNWRYKKDEIDIIARQEKFIVIVEVKTRSSNLFATPESAVDNAKQQRLIRAANAFIDKHQIENEIRFDVISIILNNPPKIHHIKDAFSILG